MVISPDDEFVVTVSEDFGAALRHFRTQQQLSQAVVADWESVSQPYLSALEAGSFGSSLSHALRILRLLGCEIVVRSVQT